MREIEFRGKRIDNGEWVYGSLVQNEYWTEIWVYHPQEGQETFHNVDKSTVGQYTGVFDCREKKVYEDDILECTEFEGDEKYTCVVSKDNTSSIPVDFDGRDTMMALKDVGYRVGLKFSVIGNIHDNPEFGNGVTSKKEKNYGRKYKR